MEAEFTAILTEGNKLIPAVHNEVLNLLTFVKSIDWTEPWLIGLLCFHVLVMVVTIVTRHHGNFQGVFFFSLLMLVLFAKSINELGANHWTYFSRQQYFDSHGMFISIVFSSPILLNCLIMIGHWLWLSGSMTIRIKQAQLKARLRAESRLRKQKRGSSERKNESDAEQKDDSHRNRAKDQDHPKHD